MPDITSLTSRQFFLLITVFAALLSASGIILEYGFNVLPCHMCWWQRYMHYGILGLGLAGFIVPQKHATKIFMAIALAAVIGLGIALWQFAAQHGWLPFPASCTSGGMPTYASGEDLLAAMNTTKVVPCDKENFTLLGLSLAGWNIPAMLLVIAMSIKAFASDKP